MVANVRAKFTLWWNYSLLSQTPRVLLHCGFHSTEEVEMPVGEWLQMQELSFYHTGIVTSEA